MNKKILGNLLLFITSFIWGSTFVAQVMGMDLIGPFTFSASRSFVGAIFLGILLYFLKDNMNSSKKDILKGGLACGFFLFVGSSFQQIGLLYTTAGKTSFITSLYILIIPIFSYFILKNKINFLTIVAIILGIIGLYMIAIKDISNLDVNRGDMIVFIGSFFWGAHILVIDHYSKKVNAVKLSFLQFLVTAIFSMVVAYFFEKETATLINITLSWKAIIYAGFLSSGVAYTLQMIGQRYTDPILASLILSLESVFGAISGYLFLNEIMSFREFAGCCIVFMGIMIAQVPENFLKKINLMAKKDKL